MAEEEIDPPSEIVTVGDSSAGSPRRGENYAYAFEHAAVIRAAIDRAHVKPDAPIAGARKSRSFRR